MHANALEGLGRSKEARKYWRRVEKLQRAFAQIFAQDADNAKKIMADCVASGLWVSDAADNPDAVDDPRFNNRGEAGQRDSDSD